MNKENFEQFEARLRSRGYNRYEENISKADYILGKGFHKSTNKSNRSSYNLLLYIYDWSNKEHLNIPPVLRDTVNIEVHIRISRTPDEIIEMILPFRGKDTIKSIETEAEAFFKWAEQIWSEPRENL